MIIWPGSGWNLVHMVCEEKAHWEMISEESWYLPAWVNTLGGSLAISVTSCKYD